MAVEAGEGGCEEPRVLGELPFRQILRFAFAQAFGKGNYEYPIPDAPGPSTQDPAPASTRAGSPARSGISSQRSSGSGPDGFLPGLARGEQGEAVEVGVGVVGRYQARGVGWLEAESEMAVASCDGETREYTCLCIVQGV